MILGAFRVRSFRFQWPADLLTAWAFEMETLVLGWYVMVSTGSVLWLTAFGSLQYFGTLAAPAYGVLGDRVGGRLILCVMRTIYVGLALLLTGLAVSGRLTPAWVLVVATVGGLVRPNDLVMRNTLIAETIPREHLLGALALSRATMDSARVAGALAGAALSSALGLGVTYVFVTVFYAASLALTFGVARRPPVPAPGTATRTAALPGPSGWGDLKDGLVHVWTQPALLAMMLLAFLVNLTAYPISGSLLPYAAREVYRVDATGLGWLAAAFSFGGLLASLTMVLSGAVRRPERPTLVCTALWYVALLGFAQVSSLPAGLLALLVAGYVQNVAMISMTAALLAVAGERFRARVMGVRMLAVYGLPIGLVASGLVIAQLGYVATVTAAAAMGLLCTLLIGVRWRSTLWHRPGLAAAAPGAHARTSA